MTFNCSECGQDSGSSLVCRTCIPHLSRNRFEKIMRTWHKLVVVRDGCMCVHCGYSAEWESGKLCGNHKQTRNVAPHLVFDIDNGECCCMPCNNKFSYSASKEAKQEVVRKQKVKQNLCPKHKMLVIRDGKCLKCL